jgi:membrane associated rhomboid family serine protease
MKRLREMLSAVRLPALSILVALAVGGLVIMLSDLEVLAMIPSNPIGALGEGISRVGAAYSVIQSESRRRSHQAIL